MTARHRLSRKEVAGLPTGSPAEILVPRPFPKPHLFWKHVVKTDGCWEWVGTMNSYGYGSVTRYFGGLKGIKRQFMAHRVAYELLVGPIPDGLVIDHLCRNTRCVNPAHMEPVTDRVNILRGFGASAMQARRTHCVNGHPFTEKRGTRGERVCAVCIKAKNAAYYAEESKRLGRSPHNRAKTHCLRGHPLDGPDIYIDRKGRRQCRACERERHRSRVA